MENTQTKETTILHFEVVLFSNQYKSFIHIFERGYEKNLLQIYND